MRKSRGDSSKRDFPEDLLGDLAAFLHLIREPLAVRSSSMLEDSQYHPFAGVYQTYMIPNNHPDPFVRLGQLVTTIKRVYASTFYQAGEGLLQSHRLSARRRKDVGHRPEDGGQTARDALLSGFCRSGEILQLLSRAAAEAAGRHRFSVALGLGKTIVDGGVTVRFCPKYPDHLLQFFSAAEALANNQSQFFALDLNAPPTQTPKRGICWSRVSALRMPKRTAPCHSLASTYSPENDALV